MSYSPSSPVTGSAQTGFTSPTYTLSLDVAPSWNGIQYAVTALGGTQTGVTTHSISSPFTVTFSRPKTMKTLGLPNANGYYGSVPNNEFHLTTRKGATPADGQPDRAARITTTIAVPAGTDSYDPAEIRAMLSLHIGVLDAESAGIGDTCVSGVM